MHLPLFMLRIPLFLALATPLTAAEKITFDDHILPILESSCTNCHNPDKKKGGLDLSSYSALMAGGSGGKVTLAGEGADSRLFLTSSHLAEPFMPPKGEKLDKKQLEQIRAWIDGGLLETANSRAKKSTQTKISFASTSLGKPDGPPPMPEHLSTEPVTTPTTSTAIHALTSSPWSPLIALTGQQQVLLYQSDSLDLVGVLPFPKGQPTALAFHPSGNYLTAAGGVPGKSGSTVTWDIKTGKVITSVAREYDSILATSVRADMQSVATGGPSRLIKTWNTSTHELEHSIKQHTDWVTAMSYSHDGVLLASGDRNGGVWVWEAYSGQQLHNLRGHQGQIVSLKWSADSNFLATASEDGSIRFWDMNTGKQIKKMDAHKGGVLAFDWAKDGHAISSGRDLKIKLWKPDYNLLTELQSDLGLITKTTFSHDGKRFFTANYHGKVTAWDSATHKKIGQISSIPQSIAHRIQRAHSIRAKAVKNLEQPETILKEFKATQAKLKHDLQNCQHQLSTEQAQRSHLTDQLKKISHSKKSIESKVAQAKAERATLQSILEHKSKALQTLKNQTKQNTSNLKTLEQQAIASQKKLDELKAKLIEIESLLGKNKDNQELLTEKESISKELTLHRRHHMHVATSKASAQSLSKKLTPQVSHAGKEHTAALHNFEKTDQPWEELLTQQTTIQKNLEHHTTRLADLKNSISQRTAQQAALTKNIADTANKISAQESTCKPLRDILAEANKSVRDLELAQMNAQRLSMLASYEQAKRTVAELSEAAHAEDALRIANAELVNTKNNWQKLESDYWEASKAHQ